MPRTLQFISARNSLLAAVGVLLFTSVSFAGVSTLSATASITTAQTSAPFTYTITLNNTGTENIDTFWFAWTPTPGDYDFLPTSPTSIGGPSSWIDPVTHNGFPGDGYGIEWYDIGTNPITSGNSSSAFHFTSNNTPAQLAGNAFFPGFKVTNAVIYPGFPESDPGAAFVVSVPEPASLALLGMPLVALHRRRSRCVAPR